MNQFTKQYPAKLEASELWQQAKTIAHAVREAVKTVPGTEHYAFASPAAQNAVILTSDIAYAVGKGQAAILYDYQAARGHLFTVKGLLLMAEELGFVKNTKKLMADIENLRIQIEKEIDLLENKEVDT